MSLAAYRDRRDRRELKASRLRHRRAQVARHADDGANAVEQAGDCEHQDPNALDRHAADEGSFGIAADRIDLGAKRRAMQEEVAQRHDREEDDNGNWDSEHLTLPDRRDVWGDVIDEALASDLIGKAVSDLPASQSDHQGRQPEA